MGNVNFNRYGYEYEKVSTQSVPSIDTPIFIQRIEIKNLNVINFLLHLLINNLIDLSVEYYGAIVSRFYGRVLSCEISELFW